MPIENLILVGHSLGGALAKILGAVTATRLKKRSRDDPSEAQRKLRVHAVAFSGPGVVFSSRYYGFAPIDLANTVLNIVPVRGRSSLDDIPLLHAAFTPVLPSLSGPRYHSSGGSPGREHAIYSLRLQLGRENGRIQDGHGHGVP